MPKEKRQGYKTFNNQAFYINKKQDRQDTAYHPGIFPFLFAFL